MWTWQGSCEPHGVAVLMEPATQTWELVGREVICAGVGTSQTSLQVSSLFLMGSHLVLQPGSVSRGLWAGGCPTGVWPPEILVTPTWLSVPLPWGGRKWTHRAAFPNAQTTSVWGNAPSEEPSLQQQLSIFSSSGPSYTLFAFTQTAVHLSGQAGSIRVPSSVTAAAL